MMNGIERTILLSVVWFVIWHFTASFRVGRRRDGRGNRRGGPGGGWQCYYVVYVKFDDNFKF